MTVYQYESIAVYSDLGGAVRIAGGVRAFVTDPTTGLPVNATQGAVVAPYVDADATGNVSFTAESWPVRLTSGTTYEDVWPIDAAGPADATVAGLVGAATATRTALDGRYVTDAEADTTVAALVPASTATRDALDARYATAYNVRHYGATGNGTSDDAAAVLAAIAAAKAAGGGVVLLPAGVYAIASTLVLDSTGVELRGFGSDVGHDVGASAATTQLKWTGTAGGTMVKVTAVAGASGQRVSRCKVVGIHLNGQYQAGIGLQFLSAVQCEADDLFFGGFTAHALHIDVVDTLGEARDTQHCRFTNLNFRQHTTVPEGNCVTLDGESTYNTSFNYFENISVIHKDGIGLDVGGTDNNLFVMYRCNRAAGGTGIGIRNRGGLVSSGDAATSNYYVHVSAGPGGMTFQGTEAPGVVVGANGSVMFYDTSNGAALPTLGTGCKAFYETENGDMFLSLVWTAYTPGFVNLTLGNGTVTGRYRKDRGWADVEIDITRGSTTSFTSPPYVGLPADALPHADLGTLAHLGTLIHRQASGALWLGAATRSGSNARTHLDGGLAPSNTVPFAAAAGDVLTLRLRYPHA